MSKLNYYNIIHSWTFANYFFSVLCNGLTLSID